MAFGFSLPTTDEKDADLPLLPAGVTRSQPLLRRSVLDEVTGNPLLSADALSAAPDPNEVVQRSALLPLGVTRAGDMVLASQAPVHALGTFAKGLVSSLPDAIPEAISAAQYPGQVWRGERSVFGPDGHVSDEAIGAASNLAGLAMTGGLGGAAVRQGETALGAGPIRAYHGSPHDFDKFSMSAIGSGEGAQAYGHGLYFASNEGVARSYRDALRADPNIADSLAQLALDTSGGDRTAAIKSMKSKLYFADDPEDIARYTSAHDLLASGKDPYIPQGHMYEVGINADPAKMLDWDRPLAHQAAGSDLSSIQGAKYAPDYFAKNKVVAPTGGDLMNFLRSSGYHPSNISMALEDAGIPGVRYLDQGSRFVGEGTHNYVTFSDDIVSILRKYGLAGLVGGGAAATGMMQPGDAQASTPTPLPFLGRDR